MGTPHIASLYQVVQDVSRHCLSAGESSFLISSIKFGHMGKDDEPSVEEDKGGDLLMATCVYAAYDSIR